MKLSRRLPGAQAIDAATFEIQNVTRHNNQSVDKDGCRDKTVDNRQRTSCALGRTRSNSPMSYDGQIDGQEATFESTYQIVSYPFTQRRFSARVSEYSDPSFQLAAMALKRKKIVCQEKQ